MNKAKVDVNCRNYRGDTVLDILNQAGCTSQSQSLKEKIKRTGGTTGIVLPEIQSPKEALEQQFELLLETGSEHEYAHHNRAQETSPASFPQQVRFQNVDSSQCESSRSTRRSSPISTCIDSNVGAEDAGKK